MRIEIEIPKEFEKHFEQDAFEDALCRLSTDAHLLAGNYEKETATMLIEAFKNSKPAYDVDKVVAELEEEKKQSAADWCFYRRNRNWHMHDVCDGKINAFIDAIRIVRDGGSQ